MNNILFAGLLATAFAVALSSPDAPAETSWRNVPRSFFGMHIHHLLRLPSENEPQTRWPMVPIGSLRLWDTRTRWADLEPVPGQWYFDTLDTYVDQAGANGAEILYTLGSTPKWASARPSEWCPYGSGCSAEPRSLTDWGNYVRQVARRYKGRIRYYELWNEPIFSDLPADRDRHSFYTGDVQTMVDMAKVARQVLREEDPDARLAGPGFVGGADRLDLFLSMGGKDFIDIVAYHFYALDSTPLRITEDVRRVRAVMERNGVGQLPLWNTESGWEVHASVQATPKGTLRIDRPTAAAYVAQSLALGASAGLGRFFYYSWDSEVSGFVDNKSGVTNAEAFVLQQAVRWLRNAEIGGCETADSRFVICPLRRGERRAWMVWSRAGEHDFSIPANWGAVEYELSTGGLKRLVDTGSTAIGVGSAPLLFKSDRSLWIASPASYRAG